MKCPVCGEVELERDTRDLTYVCEGGIVVVLAVTADFCAACGESITDVEETERVMREMLAAKKLGG